MAKNQAVWAVDIGQAALKALKLLPGETPDQVVAEAFDFVEYPKILSQPDADPDELVRDALKTFLERNDLKGCTIAIGVPGQSGLVKFIKLPPVEKKRIPDIVKFEARQQIPFALEEVIWDYQQIGGDSGQEEDEDFTMAEVGLFAMNRDQINRAIQPLQAAGIEVDIVQMGPIALYNFLSFDRLRGPDGKPDSSGSVVLLDIGADNTDLIISDGTRIWQRNVPIGGNHFTRALTKELKLTFAKAEHLKRNATKAPDPRSVFTAMRGIFNDFASEVNRSIGFYSSVNRQAKIVKVIGLGNGFKLPGLQKFLQQNVNHEVEKLETFERMVGDEVISAPQFQENLPSFAVAYGLGVQGLELGGLRTNLLPGEIKQVRMVRRKKPWALAASTLMMLGIATLYMGEWRALAKVSSPAFKEAVEQAKQVSAQGAQFKTAYDKAKTDFTAKLDQGKQLTETSTGQASFPAMLKMISQAIYDPSKDPKFADLDPDSPEDRPRLERLRVHIDGIVPVYRADVSTWYTELKTNAKSSMHPLDQATPPTGEGWIIQIIGHHYSEPSKDRDDGPFFHIQRRILPRMNRPEFRQFGFSHAALVWIYEDKEWTNEKGLAANGLPQDVPLLAKASAPAEAATTTSSGGAGGYGAAMASMGTSMMYGGSEGGGSAGGAAGGYGASMSKMGMGMMYGGAGGSASGAATKPELSYLYRTDFEIQLLWQPPKPEIPVVALEEITKKMQEAESKTKGGIQVNVEQLATESLEASKQAVAAEIQRQREAAGLPPDGEGTTPAAAPAATPPPQ